MYRSFGYYSIRVLNPHVRLIEPRVKPEPIPQQQPSNEKSMIRTNYISTKGSCFQDRSNSSLLHTECRRNELSDVWKLLVIKCSLADICNVHTSQCNTYLIDDISPCSSPIRTSRHKPVCLKLCQPSA